MAGRIPRQFIDDLIARTDIVELIDQRVSLKKAGKNYHACCPFHGEKTPSFTVAPDKQFYHCFGCGAHGNALGFIMEFDKLEFVEAVEELAGLHSLEIPREEGTSGGFTQVNRQQQQGDHELMNQLGHFYQQQLSQHSNSQQVNEYLTQRGLSADVIKQFGIGYAPEGWDAVVSMFGKTPPVRQQLVDLGMAIAKDRGGSYDRFRHRVMFPIRNRGGKTIGFGGRVLDDSTPKYLNSPETRIYHKGRELYGLYEARQANAKIEQLLVVEGYMDVVALAQHGISYAVASLGTSTTPEHVQLMFRQTQRVICCYDGDNAGRGAAWRALENALPFIRDGYEFKFMFLPDGEDPDTLIRKVGQQEFTQLIAQAKPLSEFFFEQLQQDVDTGNSDAMTKLAQRAMPLISRMPDSLIKDNLKTRLAKTLRINVEQLARLEVKTESQTQQARHKTPQKVTPVRLAMALLLEQASLAQTIPDSQILNGIDIPGVSLLQQLLQYCQSAPHSTTAQIVEAFREHPHGASLGKLMLWQHHVDESTREEVFLDCIERLLSEFMDKRSEILLNKASIQGLTDQEKAELQQLLRAKQ